MIKGNLNTNPHDPNTIMNQGVGSPTKGRSSTFDRLALIDNLKEQHYLETMERFVYEGLPDELEQDLIERVLYYRGSGCFFYYNDSYWFLPYTLNGSIDPYGRYISIVPVMFTGQFSDKGNPETELFMPTHLSDQVFDVVYSLKQINQTDEFKAVLIYDRSNGIPQNIIPHSQKVLVLIERLVNTLIMIETNNINGLQTYAMFVKDEATKAAVELEFQNFDDRILQGKRVQIIVGDVAVKPFEELTQAKSISDSQRYWQSYQAWDNLRKELIGLENGGQHLKMEHATEAETQMSSGGASGIMSNALRTRQKALDLINEQFGLSITINEVQQENEELLAEGSSQTEQIIEGGIDDAV